jgi:RNA polymerase sigma-B factor
VSGPDGGSQDHPRADDPEVMALFGRLPGDAQARARLVERFQPLSMYLARKFIGRGEDLQDLTQVANLGLLNAIDRFDTERGVQFSTYAAATIVGELKRHFRDKTWAVKVPRRLQELSSAYQGAVPLLKQQLGRSPTVPELAAYLEASSEDIADAIDAAQAYSASSLDAPAPLTGRPIAESLGGADPSIEIVERWADLAPAIKTLSERDRTVLYLRFARDMTQSEIADEIGVSQMHVSRILNQTLEVLRTSQG